MERIGGGTDPRESVVVVGRKGSEPILLIEDDWHLAAVVSLWLEDAGFRVTHADRSVAALEILEAEDWFAVVSDIELPGRNGLELVAELRDLLPGIPILLMTAHERIDYAVGALRQKADDFVVKPLEEEDFVSRVRRLGNEGRGRRPRSVLAVGAHPDDVEIGCGGILLKHRGDGDRVTILILSRGARGGPAKERAVESARAAKALGCELILRDLVDTEIAEGGATISAIEEAIAVAEADVVYTHSDHDNHQDHRNSHRASLVAARPVGSVFCYQSPSSTVAFQPSRFVEIEKQLDAKVEALACYRTQVSSRKYLTEALIRATALYWGRYGTFGPVEPLEVVRSCD